MIIKNTQAFYFRLPFTNPMRVGKYRLLQREGFIVRLTDDFGNTGFGEIAPLPGLDTATLEDCRREIRAFSRMVKTGFCRELVFNPSVRFGIEAAIFAMTEGLRRKIGGEPDVAMEAAVNGLFVPDDDSDAERMQVKRLLNNGFETIKVKIGRRSPVSETASIRRLFERSGGTIRFRFDANRSLTASRYKNYHSMLGDLPVEYVEEPLENGDLERAGEVGWPLAIDESLPFFWDHENRVFKNLPDAVTHAVIKPGTPSGFREVIGYFGRDANARIRPVVSSAFNTAIGTCALMLFLYPVPLARRTAHGLDAGSFLSNDLLDGALQVKNGRLSARVNILWANRFPVDAPLVEIDL